MRTVQTIKVEQIEAVLNSGNQEVISEFFFGDPKIKNSGFLTKLAYSDGTGKKNMDHTGDSNLIRIVNIFHISS